ncbi:protein MAK16 [Hordeum vulgare]|nr:protein MAK16 [Hordeum vulgare]
MTQYRIRMRKLQLKVREKIMTVPRKKTQRDLQRLEKAEKAAQLEKSIESELIERLRKGVYGGVIHNVPFSQFDTILDMEKDGLAPELEEEEEGEIEYVEGADIEMGEMEDMEDFEGFGGEGDDGDGDNSFDEPFTRKPKRSGSDTMSKIGWKSTKVAAEVEQDEDRNSRLRMRM